MRVEIKEDGSLDLTLIQKEQLKKHFGKLAIVSVPTKKRSLSQNSYYWAYLHIVETETGNNADDLHEYFKRTLLPPKFIKIKGKRGEKEIKIPKSTTELSKLEMGEYLDKISAMTGVSLPDPKEAGYIT